MSTRFASRSDRPTSCPWARRNVNAIPPPTSSRSTRPRSDSISASLSETLAPPEDGDERARGGVEDPREGGELLLHEEPGHRRPEMPRDPLGRGVGPVRRGEGVVHVDVAEPRQRPRERGVVRLLARVEAEVLEEEHAAPAAARSPGPRRPTRRSPAASGTGSPEERPEAPRDGRQRELRLGPALGPAEVRGDDHRARAPRPRVAEGRQRRADPRVLAHLAVTPERDVEVDPHEHPAVPEVEVLDRALGHGGDGAAGRARPLQGPGAYRLRPMKATRSRTRLE